MNRFGDQQMCRRNNLPYTGTLDCDCRFEKVWGERQARFLP